MRFTVDNRSSLAPIQVFERITRIVEGGEVSETKAGRQYCFLTVFKDGVQIAVVRRKKSQTFVVMDGP